MASWMDDLGEDKGALSKWRRSRGRPRKPRGQGVGKQFGRTRFMPANIHPVFEEMRELRIAKNISIEMLAERMGIDLSTLGRWERGEIVPSTLRFLDWCKALDVKMTIGELKL